MGLAERRRIRQIKDVHTPRFQTELEAALSFEIPFEIDVDSFPEVSTVLDCYDFYFENYGPGLVVDVLGEICRDDIGKEAIQERIKKIVFQNTALEAEKAGSMSIDLEDSTLTVRESFHGTSEKLYGKADMLAAIENLL